MFRQEQVADPLYFNHPKCKMSVLHNPASCKLKNFLYMSFSAVFLQPLHEFFCWVYSAASIGLSDKGFAPATIRGRLTSLCLLSDLSSLPPTPINYNYISSFLLLFFFCLHLFKTTHCHLIYLPDSCTNLSLDQMIYPCQGATE